VSIDDDIVEHYKSGIESNRLFTGVSQFERVRTQEIILRYLTKTPSRILDVGGATGFYSFWLSGIGHEVHLVDPVSLHIKQAKKQPLPFLPDCFATLAMTRGVIRVRGR